MTNPEANHLVSGGPFTYRNHRAPPLHFGLLLAKSRSILAPRGPLKTQLLPKTSGNPREKNKQHEIQKKTREREKRTNKHAKRKLSASALADRTFSASDAPRPRPCVQDTDCELHDWGQWPFGSGKRRPDVSPNQLTPAVVFFGVFFWGGNADFVCVYKYVCVYIYRGSLNSALEYSKVGR